MNKNNAKALSTLRQKTRKYNRDFEPHISSYKQVGLRRAAAASAAGTALP